MGAPAIPPSPVSAESVAAIFPKSDQAQGLLRVLTNPTRHASILVISDSTGNEQDEWVAMLAQTLAAKYPAITVRYRLWKSNQLYGNGDPNDLNFSPAQGPSIISTGTSGFNLDIFDFAVPGVKPNYSQSFRFLRGVQEITSQSIYPDASDTLDLLIMNHGHNLFWPDNPSSLALAYASCVESVKRVHPQAGVICIKQAPWRDISEVVSYSGAVTSYSAAGSATSVYDNSANWYQPLQAASTLAGTVSVTAGGLVTGTGTAFVSTMVGQPISIGAISRDFEIASWSSATSLYITEIGGSAYAGGAVPSGSSFYVRPGKYSGYQFRVTEGAGVGQVAQIIANSNKRLVFSSAFATALDSTSKYVIENISGTATSGSSTSIVDASRTWMAASLVNMQVRIISGACAGQRRVITSNTFNTCVVSPAWTNGTPNSTSKYVIENISVEAKRRLVAEYASRRGYGVADSYSAFVSAGNGPELHIDYLHPSKGFAPPSGSKLIHDAVMEHFILSPVFSGKIVESTLAQPATNIIGNGGMKAWATTTLPPDGWTVSGGTAAQDTSFSDSQKGYSCKIVADGSGQSYIQYTLSAAEFASLRGKWVTLNVRIAFPATATATTQGRISLSSSSESVISIHETPQVVGTVNGSVVGWMWKGISIYIKPSDTSLNIKIYNDSAASPVSGSYINVDRVTLAEGMFLKDAG